MTRSDDSYWVPVPPLGDSDRYPCAARGVGMGRFLPGDPYPLRLHELDYPYDWSKGRVLQAYQIIYVTHGTGKFCSGDARKCQSVEAGNVLLLFPGVWHHYAPDTKTGWTEHWIECIGVAFEQAVKQRRIRPEEPVLKLGMNQDLVDAFNLCHRWARRPTPARAATLATLALHLLAVVEAAHETPGPPSEVDRVIEQAQAVIIERFHERLDMRALASSLGVGYSYLRQRFKARTGVSLKAYHVQVRLQRAQDLLVNSDKSVKEIARLLGFDSPYHFSTQFKSRTGFAPLFWRRRAARRRASRSA